MTTQPPFFQLRSVERALLEADAIPLLGGVPPFPWSALVERLRTLFGIADLRIEASPPVWADARESYQGRPEQFGLVCPAVQGKLAWLMSTQEQHLLMEILCGGNDSMAALIDGPLRHSFVRFLAVEVIGALRACKFPPELLPQLAEIDPFVGPALVTDVKVSAGEKSAMGRVLLPESFCRGVRQAFAPHRPSKLRDEVAHTLTVSVHVIAGETTLSSEEFYGIQVGDCVLLDRTYVNPENGKGSVVLEVAGKAICQGNLTNGRIAL